MKKSTPEIRDETGRFKQGHSGNPGGRPSTRPFKDALEAALADADTNTTALREVADKLLSKAKGGDLQAINSLVDRLDGKPVATIRLNLQKKLSELSPAEAISVIADQVTAGQISPQEGQQLTSLVESRIKAVELEEIEERLSKLEGRK